MIFFSSGERINLDAKLNVNVGENNAAEMTFTGEATEAVKTFFQNGMFAALNGNVEFCQDRKCSRVMLCNTDLCNKFEPQQWQTVHEYDCPAEQWRNQQGGMYRNSNFLNLIWIKLIHHYLHFLKYAKIANVVSRVQLVMNVTNRLVNVTASQV